MNALIHFLRNVVVTRGLLRFYLIKITKKKTVLHILQAHEATRRHKSTMVRASRLAPIYVEASRLSLPSQCDQECGGGHQTRQVACQGRMGLPLMDAHCPQPRPESRRSCNSHSCASPLLSHRWHSGSWSPVCAGCRTFFLCARGVVSERGVGRGVRSFPRHF